MSHIGQTKKRPFMLKNIDINVIYGKYGLLDQMSTVSSNIEQNTDHVTNITKISDIMLEESSNQAISFLDENKKKYNVTVTMADWLTKKKIPNRTSIKCFWCKHNFSTSPLGCPVKYVNSIVEKSYISHITKDRYYMKENVTQEKMNSIMLNSNSIEDNDMMNVIPLNKNYYLTDGNFCSFNCMIAFIKDNKHNLFYKDSYSLAHSMYHEFFGQKISLIPAPHWRILSDYGGTKTINEFRSTFNTVSYDFMFPIRDMRSISHVFKETVVSS